MLDVRRLTVEALQENSSTIELCHSRTFYQEEVAQFREVALLLWFSESATFNIDCYFWCTEDGNMPRHFSTEEADSLSKEILNLPTRNVDFSSPGIPASRLHVYKVISYPVCPYWEKPVHLSFFTHRQLSVKKTS